MTAQLVIGGLLAMFAGFVLGDIDDDLGFTVFLGGLLSLIAAPFVWLFS